MLQRALTRKPQEAQGRQEAPGGLPYDYFNTDLIYGMKVGGSRKPQELQEAPGQRAFTRKHQEAHSIRKLPCDFFNTDLIYGMSAGPLESGFARARSETNEKPSLNTSKTPAEPPLGPWRVVSRVPARELTKNTR